MTIDSIVQLISLALTPMVIIGCVVVVYLWRHGALNSLKTANRKDIDWFILGVAIAFLGGGIDNLYWGIAWSADYIGHPTRDFWFKHGTYSNAPFRQVCGVIAAFCHIKAAVGTDNTVLKRLAIVGAALGVLLVSILMSAR